MTDTSTHQNGRKRLIIEDYKIKTYKSVRELLTCGDIVVEKRGHVRALIKAAGSIQ